MLCLIPECHRHEFSVELKNVAIGEQCGLLQHRHAAPFPLPALPSLLMLKSPRQGWLGRRYYQVEHRLGGVTQFPKAACHRAHHRTLFEEQQLLLEVGHQVVQQRAELLAHPLLKSGVFAFDPQLNELSHDHVELTRGCSAST